ncbi:uncharacterized protein LOC130725457 [Lotus japonicus]|uniref:uncharacterized protein LOC130725457 n=1 Tax=Lotus japonicus TaxID=34305 RepID=UPI00258B3D88|nr:uncharacterized protein LOC130725457 [Lotus japonicus]
MGFDVGGSLFVLPDMRGWLRGLLLDATPLAISTVWWLWRARNIWCMEQKSVSWQGMVSRIIAMASDIERGFGTSEGVSVRVLRLVRWTPALSNCMVLNVDGSVMGVLSRDSFGGCIRSDQGQWKSGFFGFMDDACILHLELQALFHGLTVVWEQGYRRVDCQSDSLAAVTLVESVPPSTHLYASLIWDIKDLLGRAWTVNLHHTLREGNACADFLAKHEAGQGDALVVIEDPIPGLSLLLLADASGK